MVAFVVCRVGRRPLFARVSRSKSTPANNTSTDSEAAAEGCQASRSPTLATARCPRPFRLRTGIRPSPFERGIPAGSNTANHRLRRAPRSSSSWTPGASCSTMRDDKLLGPEATDHGPDLLSEGFLVDVELLEHPADHPVLVLSLAQQLPHARA